VYITCNSGYRGEALLKMMPKLKMKSKVRMKISTQGGEKEKKEHKTKWFSDVKLVLTRVSPSVLDLCQKSG
jgi:hypothetical protein